MYEIVEWTRLKCYHHYRIQTSPLYEEYEGTSMGIENGHAIFWNVVYVNPDGTRIFTRRFQFPTDSVFKRVVRDSEWLEARQNAFERRAVNQIIEGKLGFCVYY